jgi:GNAT superfamily N-acetyltransferase
MSLGGHPGPIPSRFVTIMLSEVTPALRPLVLALAPLPEQEPFSGVARDTLPAAELAPGRIGVTALLDGVPFGFLMLDTGPEVRAYAPADGVVGVRGVYVDAGSQGRGLGTAMLRALPAFAGARHPDATHLALTVNVNNPRAIRTYLRAGFADTGRLYHGGRIGPQHVLELAL